MTMLSKMVCMMVCDVCMMEYMTMLCMMVCEMSV